MIARVVNRVRQIMPSSHHLQKRTKVLLIIQYSVKKKGKSSKSSAKSTKMNGVISIGDFKGQKQGSSSKALKDPINTSDGYGIGLLSEGACLRRIREIPTCTVVNSYNPTNPKELIDQVWHLAEGMAYRSWFEKVSRERELTGIS